MPPAFLVDGPTDRFPYRVDRAAGEGAMGMVYRAMDVVLERPVAIKVLKSDDSGQDAAEEQRRFLQEARAAAALTHPGVTTLHRIAKIDGVPFIVMEWLEGPTLAELLRREGPLPLQRACNLTFQLLDVLDAAHRAGVVHRDIKPSNLIAIEGDRLKVTDFGIALLQGRQLVRTVAGSVLATPQFASPEQVNGARVDGRSDLFSAAVVYYQLLTGQPPFEGNTLQEMLNALLTKPPVSIRTRDPRLPARLDPWFERALAKNPDDRFASATEMKQALLRAVEASQTDRPRTATRTAAMMSAPAAIFTATSDSPWAAVQELIQSWEARPLGRMAREAFLDKLLDQPIHAAAFAGAADFGGSRLLVEQGVLLAILSPTGAIDPEARLPAEGDVTLYPAPESHRPGLMTLLATALNPGSARQENLDSSVVDLAAFGARLQEDEYQGVIRLADQGRIALALVQERRTELALLTAGWPEDPQEIGWGPWLDSITATATVFDRAVTPPTIWYRRAFRSLELEVSPPDDGERPSSLSKVLAPEQASERALMRVGQLPAGRDAVGGVPFETAQIAHFLGWMFRELPQLLVDRGKADALKYLADWLLLVRRARIYCDVERPGAGATDSFDLVTEDGDGKILHLATRIPELDASTFQEFVDRVVANKRARKKRGDIGGVFLVSRGFSDEVLEAYRTLLHQGFGNRFLGMDKSLGYEGFVRLGAGRGFHLLLVEERDDGFRPRFVKRSRAGS